MLFSDTDIEGPLWEKSLEVVQSSTTSHGGMNCHDLVIALSLRDQSIRKVLGVRQIIWSALELISGCGVKLDNTYWIPS